MPVKSFTNGFSNGFGHSNIRGFLQLIVGSHPTYEDGDILSAANWRGVRHSSAEEIVFSRDVTRKFQRVNQAGMYPVTDVALDYCEATCEFKIVRLNAVQAKQVRVKTSEEVMFNTNKTFIDLRGNAVQMDIGQFFSRKIGSLSKDNAQGKPMFGDNFNTAIVYNGKRTVGHSELDVIWTAIELKLGRAESSLKIAPFGNYKKRLVIAVDDFDDDTAVFLTSSLVDNYGNNIAKRQNTVNWKGLRDVIEEDVLNSKVEVRIDQIRKHVRSEIVNLKSF